VTHLRRSGEAHSRRNGLAALKDGLYMTVTSREEKAGYSAKTALGMTIFCFSAAKKETASGSKCEPELQVT
jgi:hypothetical protein